MSIVKMVRLTMLAVASWAWCGSWQASVASTFLFQDGVSPTPAYLIDAADLRATSPTSNFMLNRLNPDNVGSAPIRPVLSFDIDVTGGVPAGSTITNVTLTLTVNSHNAWSSLTDNERLLELHLVTTPFSEATVTWNSPWTTPGGDYSATVLSSLTSPASPATGDKIVFPSTLGFVSAANDALVNQGGLLRLILIAPNAENLGGGNYLVLDSNGYTPVGNRPPADRDGDSRANGRDAVCIGRAAVSAPTLKCSIELTY